MAESQAQYDYTTAGTKIREDLSEARFAPYLKKAGWHEGYAFNLYLYNARLSKAFLYPLHILEVVLRNGINRIFCSNHGANWPHDLDFRKILSPESLSSLDNGIARAVSGKTEDVVATLTFDFWSNLFRDEYDRSLWQTEMDVLLPNKHITRANFQTIVKKLNRFRNRIAHYEPIHTMDIMGYHKEILEVIGWLSKESSDWVKYHSTVTSVVRTKPSPNGEPKPHFKDCCDSNFSTSLSSNPLSKLPNSKFFIVEGDNKILGVVKRENIFNYLFALAENSEIIVELNAHTLNMVITHQNLQDNYSICGDLESLGKAEKIFRGKKINYLIVKSSSNVIGIIEKAHRRY